MPIRRIALIMVPVGAIGMLVASLATYGVLASIGEQIEALNSDKGDGSFTVMAFIGLGGACLLATGMVVACLQHVRPTPTAKMYFRLAAILFGFAVLLAAYGNSFLLSAFMGLVAAEILDGELYLSIVARGRLPLLIGYLSLVAAAMAVYCAVCTASPAHKPAWSAATVAALVVNLVCMLPLCLAGLWSALSVHYLETTASTSSPFDPTVIASDVSGAVMSDFLSLIAFAGYSVACLLLACAKGPESRISSWKD